MDSKTRNVGHGITTRRSTKNSHDLDNPEDVEKLIAAFENAEELAFHPWTQQAEIISNIKLQAERLRAEDRAEAEANPEYVESEEFRNRYKERVTEEWYIRDMAENATLVEICVRDGRPWEAVSWAMKLAEALTELRLKLAWEPPALWGEKQLAARKSGAEMVRRHPAEDRIVRVQTLIDHGMSKRSAFKAVSADMGISPKTVERDYYSRPKPME